MQQGIALLKLKSKYEMKERINFEEDFRTKYQEKINELLQLISNIKKNEILQIILIFF